MNNTLSDQQKSDYQENGFLVINGFLDAVELEEWRRCTSEAVAERLGTSLLNNQSDPDAYYAKVFTQCLRLADTHAGMHKLIFDPRLGKMASELSGEAGIRIWHDQALIKPPFGNPTAWHLDDPYWSFNSRNAISIWVALDDATTSNGCMYYLPGTHIKARYDNAGIGQDISALFRIYPEWKSIEPVACPCPAGSAVFHNGLTAHGAGANMTNKPRRAMTCAYMPDGSTFNGNQNILPQSYFEKLKLGDVLNDSFQNPLVWPV